MADIQNGYDFIDKRRVQNATTPVSTQGTTANYEHVSNMRARLTAINAGYFNAARLNNMTANDMAYAIRLNDDAAGI